MSFVSNNTDSTRNIVDSWKVTPREDHLQKETRDRLPIELGVKRREIPRAEKTNIFYYKPNVLRTLRLAVSSNLSRFSRNIFAASTFAGLASLGSRTNVKVAGIITCLEDSHRLAEKPQRAGSFRYSVQGSSVPHLFHIPKQNAVSRRTDMTTVRCCASFAYHWIVTWCMKN